MQRKPTSAAISVVTSVGSIKPLQGVPGRGGCITGNPFMPSGTEGGFDHGQDTESFDIFSSGGQY